MVLNAGHVPARLLHADGDSPGEGRQPRTQERWGEAVEKPLEGDGEREGAHSPGRFRCVGSGAQEVAQGLHWDGWRERRGARGARSRGVRRGEGAGEEEDKEKGVKRTMGVKATEGACGGRRESERLETDLRRGEGGRGHGAIRAWLWKRQRVR